MAESVRKRCNFAVKSSIILVKIKEDKSMVKITTNTLFYGDNLRILREHIDDESIDLIYLDPPFQSGKDYNVLFEERNGSSSKAQIQAFEDTWHWDASAQETFQEIIEKSPEKVIKTIKGFQGILGNNDMLAYLVMMAIRLVELHRVLKDTGSIYLHCDPTASHYIKILLDNIFDSKNFQNEIIWFYSIGGKSKDRFARKHDVIFFYTKSNKWIFNGDAVGVPRKTGTESFGGKIGIDKDGRKYQDKIVRATGKVYRYYLDEGKIPEDVWEIQSIQSQDAERMGYPTQKPELLLERIVKASSNKGGVILDPFCGCGTTVVMAEKLNRRWIGIDITHLAIGLIKHRLQNAFGDNVKYEVVGEPTDLSGAGELADQNKFQFQCWALGLVGARPRGIEDKKGRDRGIDGYLFFQDSNEPMDIKEIIIQVKGGEHISPSQVRDLNGVIERDNAAIGVFITLEEPTREMKKEAVSAEYYKSPLGSKHPKIQILTIEELLQGKKIDYPQGAIDVTLKKAQRVKDSLEEQSQLF